MAKEARRASFLHLRDQTEQRNNMASNLDILAMLQARHGSTALAMDMRAELYYPRTELSELMQSPCRPEESGYFGATSGSPAKITYEFEMEARQNTNMEQAATVIQEHLMDVVLE